MSNCIEKVKRYTKTLENNIKRTKKIIDSNVYYHDQIPMFSWIEISPIDACNRKCVFCPKSDEKLAPDTFNKMNIKLFEKLTDELQKINYKGTVMFAGYGEPLLSKNIFEMIRKLSPICRTEITTNADPLNTKVISKLVNSGINKIVVSLYDGPEQETKLQKLFDECRVDKNKYTLRDRWYDIDDGFGLMLTNRAGTLNFKNKNLPLNHNKKCFYAHYMMMIDWDGSVYLCTQDWNRKMKSGNLNSSSIIEIWNSKILKRFRKNLVDGKRIEAPCLKCNANGTLHGGKHSIAWSKYYEKIN